MHALKRVVYMLCGKDGTQISLDIRGELLVENTARFGPRGILITEGSFCYFMAAGFSFLLF